jgi:hypothetical protein
MMSTLGQKLKEREAREAADQMVKLERIARQEGEEAQKKLKAVVDYFDSVKQRIADDIADDIPVREITLGKTGDGSQEVASTLSVYSWIDRHAKTIESPDHPYFAVWEQFDKWAKSEDLKVSFVYNHDGYGRESWQVLHVKALVPMAA